MYTVNTEKINKLLVFIEDTIIPAIKEITEQTDKQKEYVVHHFAMQRLVQLFIESTTDVGNLLIDGFIMRDPGSYEDIIDIMEDQKVYPSSAAFVFKEIISQRKVLVVDYCSDPDNKLEEFFNLHREEIGNYTSYIREYLKNEIW